MSVGRVFDIMKYSIHDGPGIRTTVFFKGCPLNCRWCHNPESQAPGPEIMLFTERCIGCGECLKACDRGAISAHSAGKPVYSRDKCTGCGACSKACFAGARELAGRQVTAAEVIKEIEKDLIFYDESGGGVTFSGGEPLLQPEFLQTLLQECRKREIHTTLESTGFARSDIVTRLAGLVDLWLYDLKLMDETRHLAFTGVSNRLILDNLALLASRGADIVVRMPIIPGVNDDRANIIASGEFISGLGQVREVNILPYHTAGMEKYRRLGKEYTLPETLAPAEELVSQIKAQLSEYGLKVKIGG